ncbi:hypothetical protein SMICM17S_01320 [Streptomyces microflavus]
MRSLRRLRRRLLPPRRIHRTLQIGPACGVVLTTRLTLRRGGRGRSTRLGVRSTRPVLRGERLLPPVLRAGLRGIGLLRGLRSARLSGRLISPVRRLGLLSGVGLLALARLALTLVHRLALVSRLARLTGVRLLLVGPAGGGLLRCVRLLTAGARLLRRVGLLLSRVGLVLALRRLTGDLLTGDLLARGRVALLARHRRGVWGRVWPSPVHSPCCCWGAREVLRDAARSSTPRMAL